MRKSPSILLIEPPFIRLHKNSFSMNIFPLALGYLGGEIIKRTRWDVLAYNSEFFQKYDFVDLQYLTGEGFSNYIANMEQPTAPVWDEIKAVICDYNPVVVGISAKSQNFTSASIVARMAKEINPGITVVIGGPHAAMAGEKILNIPAIDIVAIGEGEDTIVELLKAFEGGAPLEAVKGIAFRKDGAIVKTPPRPLIENLDALCFPNDAAPQILKDYGDYSKYAFARVFATRGCPHDCFFCGSKKIWTRRVRFRSPDNVIEEIRRIIARGPDIIGFEDDTFGVNKKHLSTLCGAMKKEFPGLKWRCELRVDLVDEQTVTLMKESGCYQIQIGVESGNNGILKKARKGYTIEQAVAAVEAIRAYGDGIRILPFFMVGFPWETEETLMDTFHAIKTIPSDEIVYSIFTPYPGTEAFDICRTMGVVGDDFNVSLYNHQSPANMFCPGIEPSRFRKIVSGIENFIDDKNNAARK